MREMPIWMHIEADTKIRQLNNSKESKCLRVNHGVRTVGDAELVARFIKTPNHKPRKDCRCMLCKQIRKDFRCKNPHKCSMKANELLRCIPQKWNPLEPQPEDYEPQVENEDRYKRELINDETQTYTFDPRITCQGSIKDAFRIFTDGKTCNKPPWISPIDEEAQIETVYTDGSCINNGAENAQAGAGVWFSNGDDRNMAVRVPRTMKSSNNSGEILAAKIATEEAFEQRTLHMNIDSKLVIHGLTKNLRKREDLNYMDGENSALWKVTIARLRERRTPTVLQWIKGHSGNAGNDEADKLAGKGATSTSNANEVDLDIPAELRLTGAKLTALKQSDVYRMIKNRCHQSKMTNQKPYRKKIERRETAKNLDRTRYAALNLGQNIPTDETIWKALKSKDLTKKTRQFFWKVMHEAHRVGPYWLKCKNDELKDRGYCLECGVVESMEHILTECGAPGQEEIWDSVKELWKRKKGKWTKPKLPTILASTLADFTTNEEKRKPGKSRFFRIMTSEAAFLIWKLRNERVIPDEATGDIKPVTTRKEIRARLEASLNERLGEDRARMDTQKYGKKALRKKIVLGTWQGVIKNERDLPDDWTREAGVLVGIPNLDISWLDEGSEGEEDEEE